MGGKRHLRFESLSDRASLTINLALFTGKWSGSSFDLFIVRIEVRYPLNRRRGGPHRRSGLDALEERSIYWLYRDSNPGSSSS